MDSIEAADGATNAAVPQLFPARCTDQHRMLHVSRAVASLEHDILAIMERTKSANFDPGTVKWVCDKYISLREEFINLMDEDGQKDAADAIIGLDAGDTATSMVGILLRIGQFTRFVSSEESWPSVYLSNKVGGEQLLSALEAVTAGTTDTVPAQLPGSQHPSGPGYL